MEWRVDGAKMLEQLIQVCRPDVTGGRWGWWGAEATGVEHGTLVLVLSDLP